MLNNSKVNGDTFTVASFINLFFHVTWKVNINRVIIFNCVNKNKQNNQGNREGERERERERERMKRGGKEE